MSGDALRSYAQNGNLESLINCLRDRPNPCSADEYGITALHYATWNGHTECVKYLIANPNGVDARGVKTSSLNMVTTKGYTPLHLAAIDCPPWSREEIIKNLLAVGVNRTLKCQDGLTAYQHAEKSGCQSIFDEFDRLIALEEEARRIEIASKEPEKEVYLGEFADENAISLARSKAQQQLREYRSKYPLLSLKDILDTKYTFYQNDKLEWEVGKLNVGFEVPNFIYEKQKSGYLPTGMKIYEHQIRPLTDEGFLVKKGRDALDCLDFVQDEARINKLRREALILSGDPSWAPVTDEQLKEREELLKRGKSRGVSEFLLYCCACSVLLLYIAHISHII